MIPSLIASIFALPASNLSMLMLLLKATVILIAALGITLAMQRTSAGARHLVWLVTLGTLLLVPVLTAWGPLRLPILPPALPVTTASPAAITHSVSAVRNSTAPDLSQPNQTPPAAAVSSYESAEHTNASESVLSRIEGLSGFSALLAVWAAIVLLIAAWLGYGALVVRRIIRRSRPPPGRLVSLKIVQRLTP